MARLLLVLGLCVALGTGGAASGTAEEAGPAGTEARPAPQPRAVSTTLYATGATTVSWCSPDLTPSCAGSRFTNMTAVGNEFTDGFYYDSAIGRDALLQFTLPGDFWGSSVTSATLRLYPQTLPLQRDTTYRAYPIAQAWNPATVTWNTMPLQYTGVEYWEAVAASGLSVGVAADWDLTAAVQGWASGTLSANGFLLMDPAGYIPDTTAWRTAIFYSVTDAAAYRPRLILQYQPNAAWTCNGVPATWVGTEGADTFNGGSGVDVVVALGGNDVIDGEGGNDIICAGPGNDRIVGGAGNDFIHGEAGRDTVLFTGATAGVTADLRTGQVTGGAGSDSLYAVENLSGSSYRDFLTGRGNANRLEGLAGNDVLKGLGGDDVLLGGLGINDKAYGGTGEDRCVAEVKDGCEE